MKVLDKNYSRSEKDNSFKYNLINWSIFIFLSFVWGSSFKLMKIGMLELSSYEVASIRIFSAGLFLLPVSLKYIKKTNLKELAIIVLSGFLGNYAPAYLFCISETKIESSLAGIINSLMPIFVIVIGKVFFNLQLSKRKIIGVSIAFTGLSFLLLAKGLSEKLHFFYILLAVLATMSYGINSNLIANKLKSITSLKLISVSMTVLAIPSLLTLVSTGFFSRLSTQPDFIISTFASAILGIFGTAAASGLFYVLIKRAGSVFASLVTNSMPVVAVFWGFLSGESISVLQIFCLFIILGGIYYANKSVVSL